MRNTTVRSVCQLSHIKGMHVVYYGRHDGPINECLEIF